MLKWPDGRTYEGGWKHGRQHGIGYFTGPDKIKRKGEWTNG